MELTHKTLGMILLALSAILIVTLSFAKINVDSQSAVLCEKFAETGDMASCPVHENSTSWLFVLAFGIAFLMLGAGTYLIFLPAEKPPIVIEETKKEFKQIDLTKLDEDAQKIYGILKGKGGSAYQSDLVRETGFTKVKVTRILDKLEQMSILDRRRRGMTNIIVLK